MEGLSVWCWQKTCLKYMSIKENKGTSFYFAVTWRHQKIGVFPYFIFPSSSLISPKFSSVLLPFSPLVGFWDGFRASTWLICGINQSLMVEDQRASLCMAWKEWLGYGKRWYLFLFSFFPQDIKMTLERYTWKLFIPLLFLMLCKWSVKNVVLLWLLVREWRTPHPPVFQGSLFKILHLPIHQSCQTPIPFSYLHRCFSTCFI